MNHYQCIVLLEALKNKIKALEEENERLTKLLLGRPVGVTEWEKLVAERDELRERVNYYKKEVKQLHFDLAFVKPLCTHFDLEVHRQLIEDNKKLKEENQRLKAENETLRIEDVSRELRKLFTESRVKQPETCAVSGVKLDNPALKEAERIIKFRLGDRVAVHSKDRDTFRATIFNMRHNKIYVIEDGFYSAHDDNPFLPSQCRKLRKVKK